jgi:hypothetical protein
MAFTPPIEDIELMRPAPGTAHSFTAAEDVLRGQVVKLSGDNSVAPSDSDGEQCIGVSTQTVAAGDMVMVDGASALSLFTAGAAVTAGQEIASHGATGEEGEVADAVAGDLSIGIAHESATAGETFVGNVVLGGTL